MFSCKRTGLGKVGDKRHRQSKVRLEKVRVIIGWVTSMPRVARGQVVRESPLF